MPRCGSRKSNVFDSYVLNAYTNVIWQRSNALTLFGFIIFWWCDVKEIVSPVPEIGYASTSTISTFFVKMHKQQQVKFYENLIIFHFRGQYFVVITRDWVTFIYHPRKRIETSKLDNDARLRKSSNLYMSSSLRHTMQSFLEYFLRALRHRSRLGRIVKLNDKKFE